MTSISPKDAEVQLTQLDFRLGVGVGASKERARLQAIIDAGDRPQKKPGKKPTKKTKTGRTPGEPKTQQIKPQQTDAELSARIRKALRSLR